MNQDNESETGLNLTQYGMPESSYSRIEEEINYIPRVDFSIWENTGLPIDVPDYSSLYPVVMQTSHISYQNYDPNIPIISNGRRVTRYSSFGSLYSYDDSNYINKFKTFDVNQINEYFKESQLLIDFDRLINKIDNQDDYTCPVCLFLFNDPYSLKCGHTFCKGCIDRLESTNCPVCRKNYWGWGKFDGLTQQKNMKATIDNWTIRCEECNLKHPIGDNKCKQFTCTICDDIVSFRRFLSHLETECGYDLQKSGIVRSCKQCGKKVFKEHLISHLVECPKRDTVCICCRETMPYDCLDIHYCKGIYVKCDKCNRKFKSTEIDFHHMKCRPKKIYDKDRSAQKCSNMVDQRQITARERLLKKLEQKR